MGEIFGFCFFLVVSASVLYVLSYVPAFLVSGYQGGLAMLSPLWPVVATCLVVGTLPFYLFLLTILLLVVYEVEQEQGYFAGVVLLLTALLFAKFGDFNIFLFVATHPVYSLLGLLAYMTLGAFVYAPFIKWPLYVSDRLHQLREHKLKFLQDRGLNSREIPEEIKKDWTYWITNRGFSPDNLEPRIDNHRKDFFRWATFWPFSGLWTLLRDPITRFCRFAFNYLRERMDNLSRNMFKDEYRDIVKRD